MGTQQLLPPATKLGQGYIFTGVCDSVHKGGTWQVPPLGRHLPLADTPPCRYPPSQTRPPGRYTPQGTPKWNAILLNFPVYAIVDHLIVQARIHA